MDDDLSSFFSDISAIEAVPVVTDTPVCQESPTKRAKITVAASKPKVISAKPQMKLVAEESYATSSSAVNAPPASMPVAGTEFLPPSATFGAGSMLEPQVIPQPPSYKMSHPGMTDEEEKNLQSQQSGYDYAKQQKLAELGVARDGKTPKFLRMSAGKSWEDKSLAEWPDGDYRLFAGDIGNEVTDDLLSRAFSRYPSFAKAKVLRDKTTNKSRGFGFISFIDPFDCAKALREMNGRYIGNRPVKLMKSAWKDRDIKNVRKADRKEKKRKQKLGLA